jgi:prepilin-type N-terminal cleavage/methylation domain-containing protein
VTLRLQRQTALDADAPGTTRQAYTLLEMVLAVAIALLLMLVVYKAMEAQLGMVDAGREAVEESVLARALLARIGNDIVGHLPAYVAPPSSSSSSSGSSGSSGSGSGGSTSSGSSSSTSSSSSGSTSSGTASQPSSASTSSSLSGPVQFNLGVQGDNSSVAVYIRRVPRELDLAVADPNNPPLVCDLRRISYWLAGGTAQPLGLARQEVKLVTSDDQMSALPPNIADEASFVIAEEVRSLQVRYFDGQAWQDTWDGTTSGNSTGAAIGPPMAIEIKIGLAPARGLRTAKTPLTASPESNWKYYRHVVAIPTANGLPSANSTTSTTGQ